MKQTTTLLIAILVAGFCQGQKLITSYYDYNKIHPHEQYYVNAAGQKNGAYKEYNENGVVIREYTYLNGLENGPCIDYAAMGNQRVVSAKGNFKNGELDGYYVQYCKYDGYKSKIQEGQYKAGRKTGLYKTWWCEEINDNVYKGVLKSIGNYVDDNMVGEWKQYYPNGRLASKGSYVNGRENGYWAYYAQRDSVKPYSSGNYMDGKRVGKWIVPINGDNKACDMESATAYSDRTYDNSGAYTNDLVTDYYFTGEKYREVHLNPAGMETGMETSFYQSNGSVWTKWNYDKGSFQKYYESGKLMWEGMKSGQKQVGTWKNYYESGKIKREQKYNEYGRIASYTDYDENGIITKQKKEGSGGDD